MTVTIDSYKLISENNYELKWSSDLSSPLYYIYKGGSLFLTTYKEELEIILQPGENSVIEILDTAAAPTTIYRDRVALWWYAVDDVDYYCVDEYVDAEWVQRARIPEDNRRAYQWITRSLEDVTEHKFRIVAVGINGSESTAREYTLLMVRNPDVPELTYTYDSNTNKLTISET